MPFDLSLDQESAWRVMSRFGELNPTERPSDRSSTTTQEVRSWIEKWVTGSTLIILGKCQTFIALWGSGVIGEEPELRA